MTEDYLLYYDDERYLFETVRERFRSSGRLDAFDLFSIIIWKANRAKTKIARRLLKRYQTLDAASESFTKALAAAQTPEARFVVALKDWEFYLPMASAILTVLWPEDFTVYDIRVCDELQALHKVGNSSKTEKVWAGYKEYCDAVRKKVPGEMSLRDKDRYLWAKSAADDLKQDIRTGFGERKGDIHPR